MTAPVFRAVSNLAASVAVSSAVTVAKPSGVVDDDFMVAFGFYDNAPDNVDDPMIVPPAGWTVYDAISETTLSSRGRFGGIWTRKASSEGSDYAFVNDGSQTEEMGIIIVAYSGVDTTTAIDVTPTGSHFQFQDNDFTPTSPAITTITNDALIIIASGITGSTADAMVAPSGYTKRVEEFNTVNNVNMTIADKVKSTFGPDTPAAWAFTNGAATDDAYSVTIVLRPVVVSGINKAIIRRRR